MKDLYGKVARLVYAVVKVVNYQEKINPTATHVQKIVYFTIASLQIDQTHIVPLCNLPFCYSS